ncbi:MAG: hypothetical protein K5776_04655 [Lachnospiraceae bacterium]|nr:hypothetical protein [Lachnospiraceae bacterium]
MRKTLNTLRIILSLENTINVNGILYGFTRIPIIGKFIPEQIYGIRLFKIYAFVIALFYEALKIFFGEIFLFPVIFLFSVVMGSFNKASQPVAYLYAFLMASLFMTIFFDVFKSTLEAEYAVLRLGMDAKEYVKAMLLRKFLSMVLGHTFLGIPSAILAGVEWYIAILIPFAGLGFITAAIGIHMSLYAWKRSLGSRFNKKATRFSVEGGILLAMAAAFVLAIAGVIGVPFVMEYNLYLPNVIILVLAAASLFPSMLLIGRFPYGLYRTAFSDAYDKNVIQKQVNEEYNKGTVKKEVKISNTKGVKSGSSGYKYLNEIFIKRHTKILFSRLVWELIAILVTLAGMSVLLHFERMKLSDFGESVIRFIFAGHPGFYVFALYSINISAYIAYAMYTNCDSTFLKFAFYRKKEALHEMYRLRALSAAKINLIPAIIIAVFGVVSIMLTGGEDYFSQCIFTVILCLVSSILFSVRHMTVFYIFQQYTDKFKGIKSMFYYTYSFIIGVIWFALIFPRIPVVLFAIGMIFVTALYIFIADRLVGKYASKTFVLK